MSTCNMNDAISWSHSRMDLNQLVLSHNAEMRSIGQDRSPSSSHSSTSVVFHHVAPQQPFSPKRQHIMDMSYPVSHPVSYMRTPLPLPIFRQPSRDRRQRAERGEAVLSTWEGCLPEEDVVESVEIDHMEEWRRTGCDSMIAVASDFKRTATEMKPFGFDRVSPSRSIERKRLKRQVDEQEEGFFEENVVKQKRSRL